MVYAQFGLKDDEPTDGVNGPQRRGGRDITAAHLPEFCAISTPRDLVEA